MIVDSRPCPLCGAPAFPAGKLPDRSFFACGTCALCFVPPECHLVATQEYQRYLLHQNSLADVGYVKFLMLAVRALKTHVKSGEGGPARILDYGSGPTPVLVQLLNQNGYAALGYDPYFGDRSVPGCEVTSVVPRQSLFDAVVSNETVEHFRNPGKEWPVMISCLRPGGILVVVTSFVLSGLDFATWHYAGDPTHIAFYAPATFHHIGAQWGLSIVETNGCNCVVMQKVAVV